jgi:hypothetical protein
MAHRYSAILMETRSLESIYARQKWHVDRMHPSRLGHQFIADNFAHLLRMRGYEVGNVKISSTNNRSRKDSIIWMLKNGTPWFLKRSVDLLPAILILSIYELIYMARHKNEIVESNVYYPDFAAHADVHINRLQNERVS